MARLVLGVVGAVVGAYFGAPGLGYAIGSAIGGAVDPDVIKSTGPRLDDLKVQSSSYGQMIPIVYGASRITGNVIWCTDLRETQITTSDDGKGGPVQQTTTYTYAIDVGISLGDGVILGVRKVWANGTLIYNLGDDADGVTLSVSSDVADSMTVYTGSTTQLADPTIEADKGVGNVPAYRGQAYVVIANLQLANWGNRLPNIEFEVITAGTTATHGATFVQNQSFPEIYNPAYGSGYASPQLATDGNILFVLYNKSTSDGPRLIHTQNLTVWTEVTPTGLPATLATGWGASGVAVFEDAFYLIAGVDSGNNPRAGVWRSLDQGATWAQCGQLPLDGVNGFWSQVSAGVHNGYLFAYCGQNGAGTPGNTLYRSANGADWEVVRSYSTSPTNPPRGAKGMVVSHGGSLYLMKTDGNAYKSTDNGANFTQVVGGASTGGTIIATGFSFNQKLYALLQSTTGPALRVSTDNGLTWSTITGGTSALCGQDANAVPFRASLVLIDWLDNSAVPDYGAQIKLWQSSGSITRNAIPLSDIVSGICTRAGLTAGEIDVTQLTDSAWGYVLARTAAARGNLAPLQRAYMFDAVESDGKIKFVKRGNSAAVAIGVDDIGAYESGEPADLLELRRMQEAELPIVVSLNFPNVENAYQQASESCRRLLTLAEQELREDLPVPLTPAQGAALAETMMYDAHVGRTTFAFSTTRKYAKYEPTDVATVANAVATYTIRLTKKDESGPLIKWEGVAAAASVYSSSAPGRTTVKSSAQISVPGVTLYRYLDIPIIRDVDDDAGFYAAFAGALDGWGGATLFKSLDGVAYSSVASVVNAATFGTCDTTLGTFTGGNMVDEKNTLDVTLVGGTLASITYAQLLDEGNAALVGSELIHFRTATLLAAGQYRLSGLLRGRRGTEQHLATHAASERFVLLSLAGTLRVSTALAEVGVAAYYKAVSSGNTLDVTPASSFTNTAVGLMPLSVVHVAGGKQSNNDFIVTWKRRTRLDGGWRPLVDAPLGESSESYSIDVMNGASVVRTLTATSPTVTYTSAQQTTDFGGSVAAGALTVKIYQVSASVGRGFVTTATL